MLSNLKNLPFFCQNLSIINIKNKNTSGFLIRKNSLFLPSSPGINGNTPTQRFPTYVIITLEKNNFNILPVFPWNKQKLESCPKNNLFTYLHLIWFLMKNIAKDKTATSHIWPLTNLTKVNHQLIMVCKNIHRAAYHKANKIKLIKKWLWN